MDEHLLAVAVAQMCESTGNTMTESTLKMLTNVAAKYIEEIGETAAAYATLAGRSETQYFDVRGAFEDMGTSLRDLDKYHDFQRDLPFPHAVPAYPRASRVHIVESEDFHTRRRSSRGAGANASSSGNIAGSSDSAGGDADSGMSSSSSSSSSPTQQAAEEAAARALREKQRAARDPHIPSFLPALPPRHTFVATPVVPVPDSDEQNKRKRLIYENRKVEDSTSELLRRQQQQEQQPGQGGKSGGQGALKRAKLWGEADEVRGDTVKAKDERKASSETDKIAITTSSNSSKASEGGPANAFLASPPSVQALKAQGGPVPSHNPYAAHSVEESSSTGGDQTAKRLSMSGAADDAPPANKGDSSAMDVDVDVDISL